MSIDGLKIPAKHYVGMVARQNEKLPLAFLTPYGKDSSAKKRMATVDDWVSNNRRWYKQTPLPTMVIDNTPLSGFKITSDIRTTSYGGLDKWRIEDPRGFELEITSANLARLMSIGMIDRGEINDQCVWARIGGNNVLLSTSTNEYREAISNTAVAGMTASWKDAKVGNGVVLQNNLRGVWLGKMYTLERSCNVPSNGLIGDNELVVGDKSYHVIFVDQSPENCKEYFTHQMYLIANPKLAAIDSSSKMTEAQAEIMANEMILDQKCHVTVPGYKSIIGLAANKINLEEDVEITLNPIELHDKADLEKILFDRYYESGKVYLTNGDPEKLLEVSGISKSNGGDISATVYDMPAFREGQMRKLYRKMEDRSWYGGAARIDREYPSFGWNSTQMYANLKVIIHTKCGNSIETLLK